MNPIYGLAEFERSQVGKSVYIFGGEGQLASESFIKAHASGIDETQALALRKRLITAGIDPKDIHAWDCSGLPTEWLIKHGIIPGDMTADGLQNLCREVPKDKLFVGCMTFRVEDTDKDGKNEKSDRASHVGYVHEIRNGRARVIHAKGHAYGVVEEDIDGSGKSYWEWFGFPSFFEKYLEGDEVVDLLESKNPKVVASTQKGLAAAGFQMDMDPKLFGKTGPRSRDAADALRAANGLPKNGKMDEDAVAVLIDKLSAGGEWKAKYDSLQSKADKYAADCKAAAGKW